MSKSGDNRLESLLSEKNNESAKKKAKVAFLGYPFDEGVQRNGGRRGAKLGPDLLGRFCPKLVHSSIQNLESILTAYKYLMLVMFLLVLPWRKPTKTWNDL